MQLDPPAQDRRARRRLQGALVWSGLTLLAALAIALALVIASLALELGTDLQEQATHQRLLPAARQRRRRRTWSPRRRWQLLTRRPSPRAG